MLRHATEYLQWQLKTVGTVAVSCGPSRCCSGSTLLSLVFQVEEEPVFEEEEEEAAEEGGEEEEEVDAEEETEVSVI